MKAKDMREKSSEDLVELQKSLVKDAFQARFKNFTARLDDTSSLKKARRDIARVKTLLTERAKLEKKADAPKAAAPANAAAKKTSAKPVTDKTAAAGEKAAPAKKTAKAPAKKASEASK
jgi:large subunit ribosomal protein L29